MNRWPGIDEWLFSVKTFTAAMLALYLALWIDLERPYWAMATVYIVSLPLIGATRSKSIFRLIGSVIGGAATIALIPNLVDAPELLGAGLALWTGFCLYVAVLDRTPRSYLFIMAAFTAPLIGFPAVSTPDAIWDVALSRVEETWFGVICITLVGILIFPRTLGPLLSQRILVWSTNASTWAEEVLSGYDDRVSGAAHIQLAADAVELRMLASQLAYDTSQYQAATRWVGELHRRMVLLLPVLSSVRDRLNGVREAGGMTPSVEQVLADLRVWVRAGDPPPPRSEADRMRASITQCESETDPRLGWKEVMRSSLLQRLRLLVDLRQDMRDLRQHIEAGGGALATPLAVHTHAPERMHHDHVLALLSGLAATLTILVLCAFWIGTGWSAGGGMVSLASAACCLFAALDDPTPAIQRFLLSVVLAVLAVGIFQFGILPRVHDFEMLALVLATFFVPVGLLAAVPATQALGTTLGFFTATFLSLQPTYTADFVSYADGSMAAILGVAGAAVVTALTRSVGADWSARRLLRANWRYLAAIPHHHAPHQRGMMSALLLDRLGLLVPRLAAVGTGTDLAAADVLLDLRIGINMVDLQLHRDALPLPLRHAVDDVLAGTARHFEGQADTGHVQRPAPGLLNDIDRALAGAIEVPGADSREVLLRLVGIRRGLFVDAEPYQPPPHPDDVSSAEPDAKAAA